MTMSAASVADLVDSLRKSHFLNATRMEKIVKAQARFPDALTLAGELVRRGWLTREQAQQLLQGTPAAPDPAPHGTPVPAASPRRRGAWLLLLLPLLLLLGWTIWWVAHRSGSSTKSGWSTEPLAGSPSGGCSDTSDLKYLDDLEFGPSVRADFNPRLLNALKDRPLPEHEVYPWQPKNLVAVLGEHRMRNTLIASNPDGTLLAVAGTQDAFLRIGPVDTPRALHEKVVLDGHALTRALTWAPKGDVIATAGYDNVVRLWDVHDLGSVPKPVALHEDVIVSSLSFSFDGKYLLGGGQVGPEPRPRGVLWVWDVEKRRVLHKKPQVAPVTCVAFSPFADDYRALWGGGPGDGQLYLANVVQDKEPVAVDPRFDKTDDRSYVTHVAFAPDGRQAVSGHTIWDPKTAQPERTVRAWDLLRFEKDQEKRVYRGFANDPLVAFGPDSKTIAATRQSDGSLSLWDVDADSTPRRVAGAGAFSSLLFLPGGERVAFAGSVLAEWNVHVHETATGQEVHAPVGHLGPVLALAGAPDGHSIASGGHEGQARVWDLGRIAERFAVTPGGQVLSVGYHPDAGKVFYVGTATSMVPFVDAASGKPWGPGSYDERHNGGITNAAASDDGHYVLTGGYNDGTVRLWSLKQAKQVRRFPSATPGVASVALSPFGKRALWTSGKSLKLLHLRCQEVRYEWGGGTWNTFLPENGLVAILGGEAPAELWDVDRDDPRPAGTMPLKLTGAVPGAISHDGRRLATIIGGRAGAWDVKSERLLWEWTPPAHFGGVRAVGLADDGRSLFTANGDGTVYVIQLPREVPGLLPGGPPRGSP
jgi:WD40 repeat protein